MLNWSEYSRKIVGKVIISCIRNSRCTCFREHNNLNYQNHILDNSVFSINKSSRQSYILDKSKFFENEEIKMKTTWPHTKYQDSLTVHYSIVKQKEKEGDKKQLTTTTTSFNTNQILSHRTQQHTTNNYPSSSLLTPILILQYQESIQTTNDLRSVQWLHKYLKTFLCSNKTSSLIIVEVFTSVYIRTQLRLIYNNIVIILFFGSFSQQNKT